jgi:hypothetical protein
MSWLKKEKSPNTIPGLDYVNKTLQIDVWFGFLASTMLVDSVSP